MAKKAPAGYKPPKFVPAPESGIKPPTRPRSTTSGKGASNGAGDHDPFTERPEIYVGGAFAGGLALAVLLRLIGR